jgi:hypothetical protein
MRGIDRQVLARDASAALVAAACKGHQELWDRCEDEHAAATTKEQARRAAEPLVELCTSCPITQACRGWAEVDQYTGVAAGTAWLNGKPRPVHWVRRPQSRWLAS